LALPGEPDSLGAGLTARPAIPLRPTAPEDRRGAAGSVTRGTDSGPEYLLVRIRTRSSDEPRWGKAVDVYIRLDSPPTFVGVDREI
jgi:hypothetical protein